MSRERPAPARECIPRVAFPLADGSPGGPRRLAGRRRVCFRSFDAASARRAAIRGRSGGRSSLVRSAQRLQIGFEPAAMGRIQLMFRPTTASLHATFGSAKVLLLVFLTSGAADFAAAQTPAYQQASVIVPQGNDCLLHPVGETDPGKSLRVSVDLDGVARFYAIRASQPGAVQQLMLDCIDAAGKTNGYTVDLRSDDTFASRPFDPVRANLVPRPALQ